MTESTVACRLHVLLAIDADIGVVFRRGPAAWWHILKWDLAKLTLERGAWLKGSLYPTRSDRGYYRFLLFLLLPHGQDL
jgi:hypothetical protein